MKQYKIVFKEIFILAIPIIFANIISASSSLISMFLLAKINSDALAAGAIITSTYGLLIMMVISILYSVSILIGHSKGGGREHEVGRIISSGIALSFIIGIPLMGVFLYIAPILQFLHQPIKVSQMTGEYFHGLVYGLIPSLIGAVFTQFYLGVAKTKITLYFTIIGVLINSITTYLLIFGYGSIRPLGFFGAGLAASITAFILLGLNLIYILFNSEFRKYKIMTKAFFNLRYFNLLFKIGFPISMQYTMELLAFSTITYLMGIFGTESLAAQQITLQCSMLSFMVIMGISQAGSILISHNMSKDSKLNRAIICKSTLLFGALLMLLV
nr:MATE family efflux transporter [Tatlockia sp.]